MSHFKAFGMTNLQYEIRIPQKIYNRVRIIEKVYYENYWNRLYDPQSAGINLQSPQSDSTPWTLTLSPVQCARDNLYVRFCPIWTKVPIQ